MLSRHLFSILFAVLTLWPLLLYKLVWMAGTVETAGIKYFTGHENLGSVLWISTYPVIWFKSGRAHFFNGNVNVSLKPDDKLSVRYQRGNPFDAKLNS